MANHLEDECKGDILIVDDTPENLRLLSNTLTDQGYEVRAVMNGTMALSVAQTDPPDIVLLDIKMPEMDGYEVCLQLKGDIKTYDIPVIFLSALDDTPDKVKAFTVGGVDYITKPFQTEEVLARVENQLTITRLRKKLIAQNDELLRSNQALEQFTSIVSHDLRQPLQGVLGFAKLLGFKCQQTLGKEGMKLVSRIVDVASHMDELIEDLLTYSQVGSKEMTVESTDCNMVLNQVLSDIEVEISKQGATITADQLPTVLADKVQLAQLFQNLISNAIKFHRPDESSQVKISVERQAREWCFGVHDNGIGIESSQFDHIFQAFQQLMPQDYPGTGIGLATCKKVVERHQGKIWFESKLGVGTDVYFTLPIQEQD